MIRLCAPAKVNLSLHVIQKRDDGYHDLITRMQKLKLCDWIELRQTDDQQITIICDDRKVPSDETNLAVQAALSFYKTYDPDKKHGLAIELEKNIPVAAGLGGGSSDGAAVLKGLNKLYNYPFSELELIDLARPLGADLAFFVSKKSAVVAYGIGDRLAQANIIDDYNYLLVNPCFSVSTKWVYDNYRLTKKTNEFTLCGSQNDVKKSFSAEELYNDLEQVTSVRYPVIDKVKKILLACGAAGSLMSGSGPTVFGLFDKKRDSDKAIKQISKRLAEIGDFRIFSTCAYNGA